MDVQKEISLRNAISYCIENNDANTATNRIMEFIRDEKEAINYSQCCKSDSEQLKAVEDLKEFARNNCREWNVEEMEDIIDRL